MEFASYLAGEPWSDHPACTHPALAGLARAVNDLVGEESRSRIVPWIPDVIGLTSDDPLLDLTIAARATLAALPVAARDHQRSLAVALLTIDRLLAALDDPRTGSLRADIAEVFALVPGEVRWAREFSGPFPLIDLATWRKRARDLVIGRSCIAISRAIVLDPDERLLALLRSAIDETATTFPPNGGLSSSVGLEAQPRTTNPTKAWNVTGASRI